MLFVVSSTFMSFRTFTRLLVIILFPLAFLCTTYLYLYPLFHGCAFPVSNASRTTAVRTAFAQHWHFITLSDNEYRPESAPFRLLVLADPQLEGDSSLPNPEDGFLSRLDRHRENVFTPQHRKSQRKRVIKTALLELFWRDIPDVLQGLRKRLDLFGNDYYLAHIYRSLHWWSKPTHVTVLGDLLGSQWVTNDEFDARAWRYWKRVFAGGHRMDDELTLSTGQQAISLDLLSKNDVNGHGWQDRIINVAGNHDIGYAGDISKGRIARFEKHFGRVDWDIRFALPTSDAQKNSSFVPSLHLIVLNDLILDTPALDSEIQSASYDHLNSIITERSNPVEDTSSFTLLLTHVPLYKPEGVCVDAPFADFHKSDDHEGGYKSGGLKEQNHLSDHVSRSGILEGIYGMTANRNAAGHGKGRKGLILTGHDHEGCDVWHYIPDASGKSVVGEEEEDVKSDSWNSVPWRNANTSASHTGVREITLRSMMGEFGGNAGLLSLWFDFNKNAWQYEMQMCQLGIQHIWWAIHALDFITICVTTLWLTLSFVGHSPTPGTIKDTNGASATAGNRGLTARKEKA
jgi:hypothetical protein